MLGVIQKLQLFEYDHRQQKFLSKSVVFYFSGGLSKIKTVTTKHILSYDFISILVYTSVKVASGRRVL
jgi:hypothetical protein